MRLLSFFLINLTFCSPPAGYFLFEEDPCEEIICPQGQSCYSLSGNPVCLINRFPSDECDTPCSKDQACRFGICISSDLEGKVCEFDDVCTFEEVCIAGRCTKISCRPGDSFPCYSGPPMTNGIGECHSGFYLCTNDLVFTKECIDEFVPHEEVGLLGCNGLDDNCDGVTDYGTLGAVDIVFAFDTSGSMTDESQAVRLAIPLASAMYNHPDVRLGLVFFPGAAFEYKDNHQSGHWKPITAIPLVNYSMFENVLNVILSFSAISGGYNEASWDIPSMIINGEIAGTEPNPEATLVIIMFTDEEGQSYSSPENDESSMCEFIESSNTRLFVVTSEDLYGSFDDCASMVPLSTTDSPDQMVDGLSMIIERVCN